MKIVDRALHARLPEQARNFFVVFARFEYAMKQSGTYSRGGKSGVDPDWDGLAKDLGEEFFASVRAERLAQLLITEPPKKQIKQDDGSLGWRDMGAVSNARELFLAVRRVRNNLLHGGKYRDQCSGAYVEIGGSERSDALLSQSLAVLDLALNTKPEVDKYF